MTVFRVNLVFRGLGGGQEVKEYTTSKEEPRFGDRKSPFRYQTTISLAKD